jgi:histidine phosphotransfer protein HptB
MEDSPILDPQAIQALRELNPDDNGEFLREIAGIFLDDTPQRIAELDSSLATGDQSKFIRAAHSIKGSAGNMGASDLKHRAELLEHHAKDKGMLNSEELISNLKTEYQRTEAAVRALITSG